MKILELRFKNLNSLYGEWLIDFSHPEFVSNGIFALTGPTGAGKTTILDAICLALYGATPRLGKITASGNEIMSRQTGECYAEVMFESRSGRYRCHWEQRRARKHPGGRLQDQEHQLIAADTGKPVETKKSLVGKAIEAQTGMDFDRFTRSILLAQGSFDSFLKADVEQKSKILEQITGTGVYSEISKRVHLRRHQEREQLQGLELQTAAIKLLDSDQEKSLRLELKASRQAAAERALSLDRTTKAITWLNTIADLRTELDSISTEAETLEGDLRAFEPHRLRLELAAKAAGLEGPYAALNSMRQQDSADRSALKAESEQLPFLEREAATAREASASAQKQAATAKTDQHAALPLIRKVHSLDQQLDHQQRTILETQAALDQDRKKIDTLNRDRSQAATQLQTGEAELKEVHDYLHRHQRDEKLLGTLAGIEEQVSALASSRQSVSELETSQRQAQTALSQANKKHQAAVTHRDSCKDELDKAAAWLHQQHEKLLQTLNGRTLAEYRAEKESLLRKMTYLNKVVELEELRAKLEDGTPCPLCGSREHPFARGNVPVADETEREIQTLSELIEAGELLDAAVKRGETLRNEAREQLIKAETAEAAAANERRNAEQSLNQLGEHLDRNRAQLEAAGKALSAKLQPFGISKLPRDDIGSLLDGLRTRLEQWRAHTDRRSDLEKRLSDHRGELTRLTSVIQIQTETLAENQQRLENLRARHRDETRERQKIYGDKDPEAEELRLAKALAAAEEQERRADRNCNQALQALNAAAARIESIKKRIEARADELQRLTTDFSAALEAAGFPDETQFLEARLEHDRRSSLEDEAQTLERRKSELAARKQERHSRLQQEKAKKLSELSIEELNSRLGDDQKKLQELQDAVAGINYRLSDNDAAKTQVTEKLALVEARKKECDRWEKLHQLIGSADGKKYRNFAQSLTFELLVSHANGQLGKMTDRYLLIRDDQEPLALNVIDDYQAGEIRSTRNLSGGESFVVSLALALGLSRMASRNVRVDSLFLDEGFGTLDEEALETALETLSELQQEGKLIGVISHVSALHERIDTQVTIAPVSGGRSVLAGPGCSRIAPRGNRHAAP